MVKLARDFFTGTRSYFQIEDSTAEEKEMEVIPRRKLTDFIKEEPHTLYLLN